MDAPSHRFLPHTSETILAISGSTFEEIIGEAALAMGVLLLTGKSGWAAEKEYQKAATTARESRSISITAYDREALLVDFINELIYLADSESWIPATVGTVAVIEEEGRLNLKVDRFEGFTVDQHSPLVKAATYHGVQVRQRSDGWAGEVVLDI